MVGPPPSDGGSRPGSSAQSDASFATAYTQRPESSHSARPISRDIDHIKSLVSRSQASPPPAHGSITAQVFRRRSQSSASNSHTQIVQELDLLKRRLKHEQQQIVRRPSQIDPETDSDTEVDDVLDEREEEIQRLREEVAHVREQREQLLGAAESKIDALIRQKEELHGTLQRITEQLTAVGATNQELEKSLRDARDDGTNTRSELEGARMVLEQHESQLHALQTRAREDTTARDRVDEQVVQLEALKHDMEIHKIEHDALQKQHFSTTHRAERLAKQVEELKAQLDIALHQRKSAEDYHHAEHEKIVRQLTDDHRTEKAGFEGALVDLKTSHAKEMQQMRTDIAGSLYKDIEAIERKATTSESHLRQRSKEIETERQAHAAAIDAMRTERNSQTQELVRSHKLAIGDLQQRHQEMLDEKLADAAASQQQLQQRLDEAHRNALIQSQRDQQEATARRQDAEHALQTVRDEAKLHLEEQLQQLRDNHERQSQALDKKHSDAITQTQFMEKRKAQQAIEETISAAQQESEVIAVAHREELNNLREALHGELATLQAESRDLSEMHKSELAKLTADFQERLGRLAATHEAEKGSEMLAKQSLFEIEVTALQARLDAALTGQAEAERSLAVYRQQRAEEEKRAAEAYHVLEKSFSENKEEKQSLMVKLEQTEKSLRGLKRASLIGSPSANDAEELASAKLRVANLEQERDEAQALLRRSKHESSELFRQNEFLVRQIADSLSASSPINSRSGDVRDSFDGFETEPKADAVTMRSIKSEREKFSRPVTPVSPDKRRAKAEVDRAWKTRSFEDYLQRAQEELSELGNTITANESLFAQKIQEHVGDLQRAKDALAAEYKSKFDSLASEKERMEKLVTAKQTTEFAAERNQLVASYGADMDGDNAVSSKLGSLPVHRAKALRSAEERLVKEYDKRISRRKSEIALKHAEEFQSLTKDYDRRIVALLNNRRRLEGDLSVDPAKFERDMNQIDGISEQLEAEKAQSVEASPTSAKQKRQSSVLKANAPTEPETPQRLVPGPELEAPPLVSRTSQPRTPSSIPRAVSFPGNRNSPDATSQPLSLRKTTMDKSLPATPRSSVLLKPPPVPPKNELADPGPSSTVKAHDSEDRAGTVRSPNDIAHDLTIKPSIFEMHAAKERASLEAARPHFLRQSKEKWASHESSGSSRSAKLSSGMIYYHAPRQSPAKQIETP